MKKLVLFIQKDPVKYLLFLNMSSIAKKYNFETDVLIGNLEECLEQKIKDANATFIIFSYITHEYEFVNKVLNNLSKKTESKIVLVGPHTVISQTDLDKINFDAILNFNIEESFERFLKDYSKNRTIPVIENSIIKRGNHILKGRTNLKCNLNNIPFFDMSFYNKYGEIRSEIQYLTTSRGCEFNCTFCMHTAYKNLIGKDRFMYLSYSPEYVIYQLQQFKTFEKIKFFSFIGPNFIKDKKWLQKFLQRYSKDIKLPFTCFVRFEDLDEETVQLLKNNYCYGVAVGLESGNDFIRNNILKKGLSKETLFKKSSLLKKYKLRFLTFNMIGIPNESIENMLETLDINRKIKPDKVYCSIFFPIPGTPVYNTIKDSDLFYNESYATLFDTSKAHINSKDYKQIQRLYSLFYFLVYVPLPRFLIRILLALPLDRVYNQFNNLYLRSSKYIGLSEEDAKKIF